ncbi:hypothetical protein GCM10025883_38720 [Mobilicoccus caccae]|uniref:Uncharacterized protein n=1 Tax=Mobilicoccus caccae TaxID=1859295 RepID=A0ABQ6IYP8_9MICO|nr:hypothetical protein GCM10025883_38720 [Mobilicoccus caccae]
MRRALAWGFAACAVLTPGSAGAVTSGVTHSMPASSTVAHAAPSTAGVPSGRHGDAFGASATGHATAAARPTLALADVTPTVAAPDTDVTVRVTVRNTTDDVATPTVSVGVGGRLATREDVARHASRPDDLPERARTTGTALAPDATATVAVTLPAEQLRLPRPYGVLPLTVSVSGLGPTGRMATFLPYQVIKEYEPLRLGVALPLTADPDPALLTGDAQARTQAWTRMLGPDSRAERTVRAAEATGATLVADPSLLGASPAATDATATPTPTPSPTPAETDPRTAFAARVAETGNDVWFLPPGDPDVSALASAAPTLPRPPVTPTTVPGTDRAALSVAWPAGSSTSRIRSAITDASSPGAVLMRESLSDADTERTGTASRRDDAGRRIVVADDRLSTDLTEVTEETAPAIAQRALADSVALLAESPGLDRSFLLLPERGLDPDTAGIVQVVRTLQAAPWISGVPTKDIVAAPATREPVTDPGTSPEAPASPLTGENVGEVLATAGLASGLRPSIGDGLIPPMSNRC